VEDAELLGVFGGKDFRYTYPNGDEVDIPLFSSGALHKERLAPAAIRKPGASNF
jgi:hypothetical protein